MEWIKPLVEFLKKPPLKITILPALFSGVILFFPKNDYFKELYDNYKNILVIVCLVFLIFSILIIIERGYNLIKQFILKKKISRYNKKYYKERISRLDDSEHSVLVRYFFPKEINTLELDPQDAIIMGLLNDKIIARNAYGGNTFVTIKGMSISLTPQAREEIKKQYKYFEEKGKLRVEKLNLK